MSRGDSRRLARKSIRALSVVVLRVPGRCTLVLYRSQRQLQGTQHMRLEPPLSCPSAWMLQCFSQSPAAVSRLVAGQGPWCGRPPRILPGLCFEEGYRYTWRTLVCQLSLHCLCVSGEKDSPYHSLANRSEEHTSELQS